jgi:alpha-1,6-mannosyltransferase
VTAVTSHPANARHDLAALIALCAAGSAMLIFVAAAPWIIRTYSYGVFIPAAAASGIITIAATSMSASVTARSGLFVILGLALVMRLLLVGQEPFLSTDLYRYIWDGRVQAAGINPYAYVPADPALAALRDTAIYPHINRADYAVTAYPPVAEMVFLAVTRIAETLTTMRLAMIACEIAIVVVVIDLLRRLELPVTGVVAYAWHPLAIFEIANSAHVEALMIALMMAGIWLLVCARHVLGAIAVALAMLVKPYALFVLPAFWRPWDWRVPLAVIATILLCYLPYLGVGRGVFGFVSSGYLAEEDIIGGQGIWLVSLAQWPFGKLPALAAIYIVAASAIMTLLALRLAFGPERNTRETIFEIVLLLTTGLFLMSPNYAWYFLALVPFIPLGAGAPAWALTLGAFALYRPIFLPHNELLWKSLATVPFLIALAFALRRRIATRSQGATAWMT